VRLASEGDAEALLELFLDFLNWRPLVPRNPQELEAVVKGWYP
jgi:hypothetical protein